MEAQRVGGTDLASAVREAIDRRGEWEMPVVILRFGDTGEFSAAPQLRLADPKWPDRDRPFGLLAELDRGELDDLARYSDEELDRYVTEVLSW